MVSTRLITQCCVCGRIQTNGTWDSADKYRPQNLPAERVSHGYCPVCLRQTLDAVEVLSLMAKTRMTTMAR